MCMHVESPLRCLPSVTAHPPFRYAHLQACACCCRCAGCQSGWVPLTGYTASRPRGMGLGWMSWAGSWRCSGTACCRCGRTVAAAGCLWRGQLRLVACAAVHRSRKGHVRNQLGEPCLLLLPCPGALTGPSHCVPAVVGSHGARGGRLPGRLCPLQARQLGGTGRHVGGSAGAAAGWCWQCTFYMLAPAQFGCA